MNTARQYLKDGQVTRTVACPEGHGETSLFIGPVRITDDVAWEFRCAKENHVTHLFRACPDPSAPTTLEESMEWMKKQKEAVVYAASQKGGTTR